MLVYTAELDGAKGNELVEAATGPTHWHRRNSIHYKESKLLAARLRAVSLMAGASVHRGTGEMETDVILQPLCEVKLQEMELLGLRVLRLMLERIAERSANRKTVTVKLRRRALAGQSAEGILDHMTLVGK